MKLTLDLMNASIVEILALIITETRHQDSGRFLKMVSLPDHVLPVTKTFVTIHCMHFTVSK